MLQPLPRRFPYAANDHRVDYAAEDVAAVFGRSAAVYDTVIPFFARIGARLVELAEVGEGESVLDVGAGRGATLLPAAEQVGPNGRVLGIDLSEEMVAALELEAERRGLTNAVARRMNAEALELEAESFDVALSNFVLHLLPHPDDAAAELRRVLRPGGRVAASVPTGAGPHWEFLGRLFRRFRARAPRCVPMPFRPAFDLDSVLGSASLTVLFTREEQIEFVFADEQEWWEWAWSHGMRALFEALPDSDLEELRQEAFTELAALRTADGVPLVQAARFVVAQKAAQ